MPPRSRRWAYGLFWNDAGLAAGGRSAQSSPGSLASRCVLFGADLWIEWQERQLTAAVLAWNPDRGRVVRGPSVPAWQERQSCEPDSPCRVWMRLASPPASMCFVPSPWQVAQTASGSGGLLLPASPRERWGFAAKALTWSSWQSAQTVAAPRRRRPPERGVAAGAGVGVCAAAMAPARAAAHAAAKSRVAAEAPSLVSLPSSRSSTAS